MDAIFTIFLGGVLLNNYALMHFLGISTVLGNERPVKKTCCLGLSITAVMVLATLVTWPLQTYVLAPFGLEYLQILVNVAVILAATALISALCKKNCKTWFTLLAVNSAVLGVTVNAAAEGYTFVQALVYALSVGLGFLLAMVVFCGIRSKIEEQYVPKAFRGLPIQLMAASILALALFAF